MSHNKFDGLTDRELLSIVEGGLGNEPDSVIELARRFRAGVYKSEQDKRTIDELETVVDSLHTQLEKARGL